MQADRQSDVDIDQHLAGSTQQAQTKTQAQELQMGDFPRSGIRNKQVSDIESGYPDIESGYPDIRI